MNHSVHAYLLLMTCFFVFITWFVVYFLLPILTK